jgi:hypothetical protein
VPDDVSRNNETPNDHGRNSLEGKFDRDDRHHRGTQDEKHPVDRAEHDARAALDPEATDARAKRRQADLLAQFGGREKALARGDLGFTPAPGTAAEFN